MKRLSVLALVVALGCGGKSTPPPTTPLPEDKPVAENPPEPTKPTEPVKPPPVGPLAIDLAQPTPAVKLVNGGTGKKTVLAYGSGMSTVPTVELSFDFREEHKAPPELGGDGANGMPMIVFTTDALAVIDGDKIKYELLLKGSDVKPSSYGESKVPVEELKTALASLENFKISGAFETTGIPAGPIKVATTKGDDVAKQIMNLMQIALPAWPLLPIEPIGANAKWQSVTSTKLMGQVDVTITTDWQLVSRDKKGAKIKGTTKVIGMEQSKDTSKLGNIAGSGTVEATLGDKMAFPEYTSKLETGFDVTEGDKKVTLSLKIAGTMKPAAVVAPTPAPKK